MKFTIIGRKINVTDKMKDYVEKKLSKLDKFFREESEARVVLGTIKDNEYIEATVYASGMIYRAEASDREVFAAIDKIVDVIERQIRRNKTRLEKKIKKDALAAPTLISGDDYNDGEDSGEFEIVKKKRFNIKPMSVEEAILQMNLLGHSFFIFKNMDTEETNIVYKRKDKKYAVIESIE
ncbi:MAG: ribosome-associated translation inhibitor RaiA [Clostridiales bacterium]|nr:ribosome-associated translation inhibitor RaiA [Clostridiales bacterium]